MAKRKSEYCLDRGDELDHAMAEAEMPEQLASMEEYIEKQRIINDPENLVGTVVFLPPDFRHVIEKVEKWTPQQRFSGSDLLWHAFLSEVGAQKFIPRYPPVKSCWDIMVREMSKVSGVAEDNIWNQILRRKQLVWQ